MRGRCGAITREREKFRFISCVSSIPQPAALSVSSLLSISSLDGILFISGGHTNKSSRLLELFAFSATTSSFRSRLLFLSPIYVGILVESVVRFCGYQNVSKEKSQKIFAVRIFKSRRTSYVVVVSSPLEEGKSGASTKAKLIPLFTVSFPG